MSGERFERREGSARLDVRQAAQAYVKRGWRVVKLRPRSKAPALRAWQKMRIGEDEIDATFPPGSNIGVALGSASDALVNVDLDSVEAQKAGERLLPFTPMKFGHGDGVAQGLYTHHFYRVEGALPRTEKFHLPRGLTLSPRPPLAGEGAGAADAFERPAADVADAAQARLQSPAAHHTTSIAEIRSDRCQTTVPPSIHPDGSALHWVGGLGEPLHPAQVTAAELRRAVAKTAAAALIAQHWPAQGSRDEAALALAGWLVLHGWTDEAVAEFVLAVAEAAQDEEWQKRGGKARHTRETLEAGKPIMGAKALAERLRGRPGDGAKVVAKAAGWLGLTKFAPTPWGMIARGVRGVNQNLDLRDPGLGSEEDLANDLEGDLEVGTLFSEVKIEALGWVWPGRIPLGKVTILDGDPGAGEIAHHG